MSLSTTTPQLKIVPVLDEGLGNQSYVVVIAEGQALVIDPSRDPLPYLRIAAGLGLQIVYAVETHLHADFISGSRELAAGGATILAPRNAELRAAFRGLDDGDEVELGGGLMLRALGTPGHTPEHLAYLLIDRGAPQALFTGGALIPGGAARTDLIAAEQTEQLTRALHRSVPQQLARFPDDLIVYPTHGAGSFCSTGSSGERTTTLGRERRSNPLLTIDAEDAFVRAFLGELGSYPPYFARLRAVNQRGVQLYGSAMPKLRQLSLEHVGQRLEAGTTLIDARPLPEFAAGHIAGSLSIALRPAFASWLGWLAPAEGPLMFVLGPEQDRRDLVSQCLKVGYENLVGELDGGIAAWRAAGLPIRTVQLRQASDDVDPTTLDVRQVNEWDAGHLPGARHIELGSIRDSDEAIPAGPLTIYCGHGERAMSAASLLETTGHGPLAVLDGGFEAWSQAGRPVSRD